LKFSKDRTFKSFQFIEGSQVRELICELRKSKRTRRIHLRLKSKDFALLTFPYLTSRKEAERFLNEHSEWLRSKSSQFPRNVSLNEHFNNGGKICIGADKSEKTVSVHTDEKADRNWVSLENQQVKICIAPANNPEASIKDACRKLASQFLPSWLNWAENITGLKAKRIRVGDQQTRWGSCSPKATISLNWRIILLPERLGSYILFHELAHLVEMNHSPRFWEKLVGFVPDARKIDRELSREGKPIFALGREV
jgi:predicted metal-dependent hydrolase